MRLIGRYQLSDLLAGLALAVAFGWGGCSLTRSLDDLQTGKTVGPGTGGDAGTDATSDADDDGDRDVGADAALTYPPHTIKITGDNDFRPEEAFRTSTFAYSASVAWDRENLYYAVDGPAIENNDPAIWVLVYFGTGATGSGTRGGQTYGGQTAALNFDASYHMRWKGDDTFTSLMRYSPGGWQEGGKFPGLHQRKGKFVEFSLPLGTLFAPGEDARKVTMAITMIHEVMPETTFASVPEGAVVPDGSFNPPYTQSFQFDLTGGTLPNRHQAR